MNIEDIEKFFEKKAIINEDYVKITFKQREAIYGLFLKDADYGYLKAKNFWRIVPQSQLEAYKTTKNPNLARVFNGAEFSKLATYEESFN
ncbi:short-chain dehydrogenase [Flavisolibacter ginsenosidimutans]|uniref:short-chain dehydrogenase n=1 Tax=Flavisolibacter ginsenosidimutans TaxID=661481 RepID=UPI001D13C0FA|nr:short-chain dehydrogenase [Flavisolibacter ginsenosidimutans]